MKMSVMFVLLIAMFFASVAMSQQIDEQTLEPTTSPSKAPPSPSLKHVADDPKLPRVLLIGDSISMGYTLRVRELLKDKANIVRPTTNCGPTSKAMTALDDWLTTANTSAPSDRPWDVIHFNFGLHDLKYVDDKGRTVTPAEGHQNVPPDQYEKNLRELIKKLKSTGATLVWATTTPVPAGLPGHFPAEVDRYNEIAAKVMKDEGIAVDDLHAAVLPREAELQIPANVHFHSAGCDVLAGEVAGSIEKALAGRAAVPQPTKP